VKAVCKLVRRADVRLVTLTGAGGIGKTRLALQVAADLLDEMEHGVFFCGLAAVRDPALVITSIAQVLGVKENSSPSLIETLQHYLYERQMLLVLDNFEQVLAAGQRVSELLRPRPAQGNGNEPGLAADVWRARVPGAAADFARPPTPAALGGAIAVTSVALFADRARAVKSDFTLTAENAPAVAEICARLDGLPLAIELAAARCKVFSPQTMLARLTGVAGSSFLRMLTDGARDLPARHQTLRGAMDWSYNLLDVGEKSCSRGLAVFGGGCTAEATEAICNTARICQCR